METVHDQHSDGSGLLGGRGADCDRASAGHATGSQLRTRTRAPLLALAAICAALLGGAASAEAVTGPPVNTGLPIIKGTFRDEATVSTSGGKWVGTIPITKSYQWKRCDSEGNECADLSGATVYKYKPVHEDVGRRLRVTVTATNVEGSATVTSDPSPIVQPSPPRRALRPALSGLNQDGKVMTTSNGTWKGTPPLTYTYQWLKCIKLECTPIPGATELSFRLTTDLVGKQVRAVVTAHNSAGSASNTTFSSKPIVVGPPVNVSPPTISGVPIDGQTLSATTGTWAGTGPFTYTYQWRSCTLLTDECSDIPGATEPTYKAGPLDVVHLIEVVVTATGPHGIASAASPQTNAISALLPSNTELPSIVGSLLDGQLLHAVTGGWSGTEPLVYSYQWQVCNSAGEACKDISGAVEGALQLVSNDVGSTVRVIVTATNEAGSTSAASPATNIIAALLPSNTGLPSITGILTDGQLLSATTGSWSGSGPISFAYQWQQCNTAGEACKDINEATGSTLGLVSGLVGNTVRVVVTASNSGGSTQATSAASGLIAALLPSNTSLPSISGLLKDGQTLTAANGSWNGTAPISYAYQWQQCNTAGEACKDIEGATAGTLGLVSSLVGNTVRVIVTASNSGGSTQATSAATGIIAALLPSNTSLPSIGGLLEDGKTLTAAKGSWSGTTPMSFGYQWQQCNGSGGECKNITGETKETLALVSSLVKSTVRLVVTATNSGGSTQATSAATSPVLAALPINTVQPTITGILKLGEKLLAHHETWSGTAPITYTYQWQLCGALGLVGECKDIAGATGENLLLELLDVGLTMRVGVTAHNERGASETAYSKVTGLIQGLGLSPTKGTAGTNVVVKGTGVSSATSINFGSQEVEPEVRSSTEVVAEAPAGSGTVPVTVSTTEGTTHETPSTQFTYTE
jgi:uncharacterized protein YukE